MSKKNNKGRLSMSRTANEVKVLERMMKNASSRKIVVYVEGDSDFDFFRWVLDLKHADIQPMKGKENVLSAIRNINTSRKKGYLAIIDSDFDHIISVPEEENVVRSDTHDIETLMFKEDAFEFCKYSFLSQSKLEEYNLNQDLVWEETKRIGCELGLLRLLSLVEKWNISFKDRDKRDRDLHKYLSLTESKKVVFSVRDFIYDCIKESLSCTVSFQDVLRCYMDKLDTMSNYDIWELCRGHDLSQIISIIYSKKFYGKRDINMKDVETIISSTYCSAYKFKKSKMFQDLKDWQFRQGRIVLAERFR